MIADIDMDGSGTIDEGEFFRGLAALGVLCNREEAAELWQTFDLDGSGEIDFRELNKLLRRRVAPGASPVVGPQSLPGPRFWGARWGTKIAIMAASGPFWKAWKPEG